MKIPPLVIGVAILFWGVETQRVFISLPLAVIVESRHLIPTRYHFDEEEFVRISDLTSLLFLGAIALILLNNDPIHFLRITTGWVPLIFFPLIVAQLYSTGNTITIGTRLGKKSQSYTHKPIDFRIYYIINCLFAAATGNSRSEWFYAILAGVFLWLLLANRGRYFSISLFASMTLLALGVGLGMNFGMEKGYQLVMQQSFHLLHKYYRGRLQDPYRSHVNFGDTGKMKLSGKIIMRVETDDSNLPLMREASFSIYRGGSWFGNYGDYALLVPATKGEWRLKDSLSDQNSVMKVELSLPREKGLLPLPDRSTRLTSSTIFEIEQNQSGSVKVTDGAPVALYSLDLSPVREREPGGPSERYLEVPDTEQYVLEKIAGQLGVGGGRDSAKVAAVKQFFDDGFTYSLDLLGAGEYDTPLGNFLLGEKRGFCEYYATSTVLILRYLGIPSRYSVGYGYGEKSKLEGKFLVRNRHAHAWAEAWVEGGWRVVDTTPANWMVEDARNTSVLEKFQDVLSLVVHRFKIFQIGTGRDYTLVYSIVVVVLTGFLVIRIYRRMKLETSEEEKQKSHKVFLRIETPLTPLIDRLKDEGVPRQAGEGFVHWVSRCRSWHSFDEHEFAKLYQLHLRLRFDAERCSQKVGEELEQGVHKYLLEIGADK